MVAAGYRQCKLDVFPGNLEVFPGQVVYAIPSVCCGSALESQLDMPGIPLQCPGQILIRGLPFLLLQRSISSTLRLPLGIWSPYNARKGEPRNPSKESNFNCLHLKSNCYIYYSRAPHPILAEKYIQFVRASLSDPDFFPNYWMQASLLQQVTSIPSNQTKFSLIPHKHKKPHSSKQE